MAESLRHFSGPLQLPRPVVAADFAHGERRVEQLHEALGMQLQVAQQSFHSCYAHQAHFFFTFTLSYRLNSTTASMSLKKKNKLFGSSSER